MTAANPDTVATARLSLPRRIADVVRVHAANPWPTIITPWLIYVAIFVLTVGVWGAIVTAAGGADKLDEDAFSTNGGVSWVFVFLMVVAIQAMNLSFPFALGMGITRRHYYLGTIAYFLGLALMFSAGTAIFGSIERATGGWGVNGWFFTPWFLSDMGVGERFLVFLLIALFFLSFGLASGSIWVRWRIVGLYLFLGSLAVVLVGLVWLATATQSWGDVGQFFVSNTPLEIVAWTLPVTLVSAVAGYFLMARATPRS